ncbi:hypothetical protein D3C87_1596480 [compost metagenome]
MEHRHAQHALVALAHEFGLDDARGARQVVHIVDGHGIALHHELVQPCDQRRGYILKFGNKGLRLAPAPFMSVAKPEHVGPVLDEPGAVDIRGFAHEGQQLGDGVIGRALEQTHRAPIQPLQRRVRREFGYGVRLVLDCILHCVSPGDRIEHRPCAAMQHAKRRFSLRPGAKTSLNQEDAPPNRSAWRGSAAVRS